MWGAASFLIRCARCSGTPVWVRGSRSSRRCPHHVAVPPEGGGGALLALGGRRAAPVAPQLRWVRGGGVGGPPPRPLSGLCGRGGGGVGGALWSPGDAYCRPGGGGHGSPGPGGQPSAGGSRPSPAPLYREPDSRAGPRWGPSSPRPLSRGAGRPGVAVRVSGQWLAGCGAAGSPPRSLSPPSLPREVARSHASCRTVGPARARGLGGGATARVNGGAQRAHHQSDRSVSEREGGGGEWGGASGPLAPPSDGRGGGGMAVPAPGASHRLGGRTLPPPPST